jgi:hypothetical protein
MVRAFDAVFPFPAASLATSAATDTVTSPGALGVTVKV